MKKAPIGELGALPLVLVADSDADTRELCGCIFRGQGWRVASADDGLRAVRIASRLLPDVVVTDIVLPHLDGFDLAARLRHNARTARIPVVAVTGYSRPDLLARAAQSGIDNVLLKPCSPHQLVACVSRAIAVARARSGAEIVSAAVGPSPVPASAECRTIAGESRALDPRVKRRPAS